jgi:glycosyltransferase involved in cell wall biosynthesis
MTPRLRAVGRNMSPAIRNGYRYIGHRLREAIVHGQRLVQVGRAPRVVFFPSMPRCEGGSGLLRCWCIAAEMRRAGWRAIVVPPQCELGQRQRILRLERPDAIVLQMQRHPDNRPWLYRGYPAIFDVDDADFVDDRWTRIVAECCHQSRAVIAASRFTADFCRQHNPDVTIVWTGTQRPRRRPSPPPRDRAPILTWAHSAPHLSPGEFELVRAVVAELARRGLRFTFWLYRGISPEQDVAREVRELEAAVPVRMFPFMKYPRFVDSLREAAVGLAPICTRTAFSNGKSFGKVLAYLASDVAVVAADAVDHPLFFRHGCNGMLARALDDWVESAARLLTDPPFRQEIADRAWTDFGRELTTEVAAARVRAVIERVLSGTACTAPAPVS